MNLCIEKQISDNSIEIDNNTLSGLQEKASNHDDLLAKEMRTREAIGDILTLLVVLATMFIIDTKLTLIVILPIPVLLIASRIFQKHIKKAFSDVRNQVSKMNEFVQEHVTGMHIVQAFGREKYQMVFITK